MGYGSQKYTRSGALPSHKVHLLAIGGLSDGVPSSRSSRVLDFDSHKLAV